MKESSTKLQELVDLVFNTNKDIFTKNRRESDYHLFTGKSLEFGDDMITIKAFKNERPDRSIPYEELFNISVFGLNKNNITIKVASKEKNATDVSLLFVGGIFIMLSELKSSTLWDYYNNYCNFMGKYEVDLNEVIRYRELLSDIQEVLEPNITKERLNEILEKEKCINLRSSILGLLINLPIGKCISRKSVETLYSQISYILCGGKNAVKNLLKDCVEFFELVFMCNDYSMHIENELILAQFLEPNSVEDYNGDSDGKIYSNVTTVMGVITAMYLCFLSGENDDTNPVSESCSAIGEDYLKEYFRGKEISKWRLEHLDPVDDVIDKYYTRKSTNLFKINIISNKRGFFHAVKDEESYAPDDLVEGNFRSFELPLFDPSFLDVFLLNSSSSVDTSIMKMINDSLTIGEELKEENNKLKAELKDLKETDNSNNTISSEQFNLLSEKIKELEKLNSKLQERADTAESELSELECKLEEMVMYQDSDEDSDENPALENDDITSEEKIEFLNEYTIAFIGGKPDLIQKANNRGWMNLIQFNSVTELGTGKGAEVFIIMTKFCSHARVYKLHAINKDAFRVAYFNGSNVDNLISLCYRFVNKNGDKIRGINK
jgi:hypothetical protein